MHRRDIILLALALPGGALAQAAALRGTATIRERMALPPGGTLAVELLDISRADAPAERIASVRIPIEGQVPIGFVLPYDPARILPGRSYSLRAAIEIDGQIWFRTDTIHRVLQPGAGDTVELRLVRAADPRPASPALTGREWVAEEIGGKGVLDRARSTLTLAEDGRAHGSGGCNRFTGGYEVKGDHLTFSQMGSTMMACEPPVGEQEQRLHQALGAARRWRIAPEGRLLLLDAEGKVLARFARP
ncbi:META domain-containing protein [Roseicella aquatilis]|nr:META domain-containing protein [Roseicella aquatilis]